MADVLEDVWVVEGTLDGDFLADVGGGVLVLLRVDALHGDESVLGGAFQQFDIPEGALAEDGDDPPAVDELLVHHFGGTNEN